MLSRILQELRSAERTISKAELAQTLGVDESALDGMLETLVNQGKLRRVKEMTIEECQAEFEAGTHGDLCAFLIHGNSATYYEIAEA
jgi:DNA-binding Xre family transcriptional regulator